MKFVSFFICLFFLCFIHCGCIKDNGDPLHVSFFFLPLRGHLNPVLGLAEELADQGCYVTFPISEAKVEWVNKKGIHPLPITLKGVEIDDIDLESRKEVSKRSPGVMGFIESITTMLQSSMMKNFANIQRPLLRYALEEHEKGTYNPDLIITEKMCMPGADIAVIFDLPIVYFQPSLIQDYLPQHYIPAFGTGLPLNMTQTQRFTSFLTNMLPMSTIFGFLSGPFTDIRDDLGVSDKVSEFAIDRHNSVEIVATCFGFEYPKPIHPTTKLVGPLIPKQLGTIPEDIKNWLESESSDVVYMCMGTMATINNEMVEKIVKALGDKEYRVLWSLPKQQMEFIEGINIPSNFRIEHFVPQREILMHDKVKGFFSHTGASSANEAMLAEVPIVCMPFFADQFDFCQRVVSSKAGFYLDKTNFEAQELSDKINSILYDDEIRNGAKRTKNILSCGGVKAAADIVHDVYENGVGHLITNKENLQGLQKSGMDVKLLEWGIVITLFLCFIITLRIFKCCLCCVFGKGSKPKKQKKE